MAAMYCRLSLKIARLRIRPQRNQLMTCTIRQSSTRQCLGKGKMEGGSATKFQQVPIRKAAGHCAWFLKSQAKHARACFRRTNPSRQAPSCHRSGCSKARIWMICHSGMFLQLLACLASAWTAGLETLYMGGLKQRIGEVGCTPLRWPIQSANGLVGVMQRPMWLCRSWEGTEPARDGSCSPNPQPASDEFSVL